jgi:membrane-associated protein
LADQLIIEKSDAGHDRLYPAANGPRPIDRVPLQSPALHDFRDPLMDLLGAFLDLVIHLDRHLAEIARHYGGWIYGVIFVVIFCETGLVVTPFLPGDSLLFVAGALWAASDMSPHPLAITIVLAAFCGDNVNYFIGRSVGPRVFHGTHSRFLNQRVLERTRAFYERHGGKTVIMARFIPLVRTFAPFVAGVGRMQYSRYILYSITASLLWVGLLVYAGYYFGNVPVVKNHFSIVVLVIIAASMTPVVVQFVRARLRRS